MYSLKSLKVGCHTGMRVGDLAHMHKMPQINAHTREPSGSVVECLTRG